ncbi:MAG: outer membrane beta-barrel protein [Schleiferiaceae bacterium]|nr:outer membrane beta-barrel protein [Schleiferiaceae bacterium]
MKNSVIFCFFLFINGMFVTAQTQRDEGISFGIQFSQLTDFEKDAPSFRGFTIFGSYALTEKLSAGVSIGMLFNSTQESDSMTMYSTNSRFSPYALFLNYKFSEKSFQPYVGLDLGFYRITRAYSTSFNQVTSVMTIEERLLWFSGLIGFEYRMSHFVSLNCNLRYLLSDAAFSSVEDTQYLGGNLGFRFHFK